MRFHVIGLPNTQTHRRHCACAFTYRVLNFCRMMRDLGHEVIHYGAEGSEPGCEHVTMLTSDEQRQLFGREDLSKPYAMTFDPNDEHWQRFNARSAREILPRSNPRDFVCIIGGTAQQPLLDMLPRDRMLVEIGIGYLGSFAPYRVFDSYALLHSQWAREQRDPDGRNYDVVIPNCYDVQDFPAGAGGQDFGFLGRIVKRKGLMIAAKVCEALGRKLVVAGQGARLVDGRLIADDGEIYAGCEIEYLGHVDPVRKAAFLGGLAALFVPTLYVEPFGGVNVEAQLCGTPVITSDWGGFVETNTPGVSGFRCRTLEQFVWAAKNIDRLDRGEIRERARRKWSMETVSAMYQDYFAMLSDLWGDGWNCLARLDARTELALVQ